MRNLTFGLMLLFIVACGDDDTIDNQPTDSVTTGDVVVDTTSLDTPVELPDTTGDMF